MAGSPFADLDDNTALIIGFVTAAVVGAVVSVIVSVLVNDAIAGTLPATGADSDVMLRNHEAIQWTRDTLGRISMVTIDREVA